MVLISARLDFGVALGRVQFDSNTPHLALTFCFVATASASSLAVALRHRLMCSARFLFSKHICIGKTIMGSIFGIIETLLWCGTILGTTFIVLLSLPACQLRAFLLPIASWAVAVFCGVYCIMPVDLVPEALLGPLGLIDDMGMLAAGIAAARMAISTKKGKHCDEAFRDVGSENSTR